MDLDQQQPFFSNKDNQVIDIQQYEPEENKDEKKYDHSGKPLHFQLTQNNIQQPFCLIFSPPQQGKTYHIFKILLPALIKKDNKKCHVIVFSQTITSQINDEYLKMIQKEFNCYLYQYDDLPNVKTKDEMKNILLKHVDQENKQDILKEGRIVVKNEQNLFYDQQTYQPKIIIVLDDINDEKNELTRMILRIRRHLNICVLYATQSYISISPKIRQLCDIFCFRNIQYKHMEIFHSNFVQGKMQLKLFLHISQFINDHTKHFNLVVQPYNKENYMSIQYDRKIEVDKFKAIYDELEENSYQIIDKILEDLIGKENYIDSFYDVKKLVANQK